MNFDEAIERIEKEDAQLLVSQGRTLGMEEAAKIAERGICAPESPCTSQWCAGRREVAMRIREAAKQ